MVNTTRTAEVDKANAEWLNDLVNMQRTEIETLRNSLARSEAEIDKMKMLMSVAVHRLIMLQDIALIEKITIKEPPDEIPF